MTKPQGIRWTASRKREVVAAILFDSVSREATIAKYPDLTTEELESWIVAYRRGAGDASALRQVAMLGARKTPAPA